MVITCRLGPPLFMLDIRTLLIVFAFVHILQATGLVYVRLVHRDYPPTLYWAIGSYSIALGTVISLSSNAFPLPIMMISGLFFIILGQMIFNSGIVTACLRQPPWWWAFGVLAISMLLLGRLPDSMTKQLLLTGVAIAICNGYSIAVILHQPSGPLKSSLLLLAGLQSVEVIAFAGRAVLTDQQILHADVVETLFILTMMSTTFLTAITLAIFTSQRLQVELRHAARHDALTGLYNRRAFVELANREWQRVVRHHEQSAILMMDIDFFKRLNDTFGHQVGDEVLQTVATTIRQEMRGEEILCRYGGEEFVAFLAITNQSQAVIVAERLRTAVAAIHLPAIGDYPLTISIGVAITTPDHKWWDEVISAADIALYQAKDQGRNRVCVFAPSDQPAAVMEAPTPNVLTT